MSDFWAGLVQVGLLILALALVYRPLGDYMARVFTSTKHSRVEKAIYKIGRVDADAEQHWKTYATGVLAFSFVSVLLLYLLQRLQPLLPLNFGRTVTPGVAFNTAVSFVTNTNWQSYIPESVMGHTVQMAGSRSGRGHGACPRVRPLQDRPAGQLLGGPDPRHDPDPAADLVPVRDRADRVRCRAEPEVGCGRDQC
jgi:hypothetical protein